MAIAKTEQKIIGIFITPMDEIFLIDRDAHGMWIDSQGNIYLAGQVEGITRLVKAQG